MVYCIHCGREHDTAASYCPECEVEIWIASADSMEYTHHPNAVHAADSTGDTGRSGRWSWRAPRIPAPTPRLLVYYGIVAGLVLLTLTALSSTVGVGPSLALLPTPLDRVVVGFVVAVLVVGLPVAGVLLVTDTLRAFRRRG